MTAQSRQRLRLHPSWAAQVGDHFELPAMSALRSYLRQRRDAGARIYPPMDQVFAALDATPFDQVKVVILGQDPYHGPGQAHGLSFSVPPGMRVPPSLANIYAELQRDLHIPPADHGCLLPWAQRGVLLLNTVLTVEEGVAGAHRDRGWEGFTDACIDALNNARENLVFMLWGSHARSKAPQIDRRRHCILQTTHPSPLSAWRGFAGCGHFSAGNRYLQGAGVGPVDWRLPPAAELAAAATE